jgi:hypothetical protein
VFQRWPCHFHIFCLLSCLCSRSSPFTSSLPVPLHEFKRQPSTSSLPVSYLVCVSVVAFSLPHFLSPFLFVFHWLFLTSCPPHHELKRKPSNFLTSCLLSCLCLALPRLLYPTLCSRGSVVTSSLPVPCYIGSLFNLYTSYTGAILFYSTRGGHLPYLSFPVRYVVSMRWLYYFFSFMYVRSRRQPCHFLSFFVARRYCCCPLIVFES